MFFTKVNIWELVVARVHGEGSFNKAHLRTSGIRGNYLLLKVDVVLNENLLSDDGLVASQLTIISLGPHDYLSVAKFGLKVVVASLTMPFGFVNTRYGVEASR